MTPDPQVGPIEHLAQWLLPVVVGLVSALGGRWLIAWSERRKASSAEHATDVQATTEFRRDLMARVTALEAQQVAERAHCERQLSQLRVMVETLKLKLEVLRSKAKVPSETWQAIEDEIDRGATSGNADK